MAEVVVVGLLTTTPLLQTNFLLDLMQMNFLPRYVFSIPSFEQTDPAFGGVAE